MQKSAPVGRSGVQHQQSRGGSTRWLDEAQPSQRRSRREARRFAHRFRRRRPSPWPWRGRRRLVGRSRRRRKSQRAEWRAAAWWPFRDGFRGADDVFHRYRWRGWAQDLSDLRDRSSEMRARVRSIQLHAVHPHGRRSGGRKIQVGSPFFFVAENLAVFTADVRHDEGGHGRYAHMVDGSSPCRVRHLQGPPAGRRRRRLCASLLPPQNEPLHHPPCAPCPLSGSAELRRRPAAAAAAAESVRLERGEKVQPTGSAAC